MEHGQGATVTEFVRALKGRGIPLPFEVGTFIALDVCNSLALQPCHVSGSNVYVNDLGEVTVKPVSPAKDPALTRETIQLLGELLVASAPGVPEPLLAIVERAGDGGRYRLDQLRDDLEAALIPLNRGAAMRALARISREAFKMSRSRPVEADEVGDDEVEDALDSLLGVNAREAAALRDPAIRAMPSVAPAARTMVQATVRAVTSLDDSGRRSRGDDTSVLRLEQDRPSRLQERLRRLPPVASWGVAGSAVLTLLLMVWAFSGSEDEAPPPPSATRELPPTVVTSSAAIAVNPGAVAEAPAKASQVKEARADQGTVAPPGKLSLSTLPAGAQVLIRIKNPDEPVVVERGLAHEFIFVPDGEAPSRRVLMPSDAEFYNVGQGLPVHQIDLSSGIAGPNEGLGPTLMRAKALGEATGEVGLVQLSAPVPGQWYKFLGATPGTGFGPLPTNVPVDLLLFRRGFRPLPLSVQPDQWRLQQEGHPLLLSLELALQPSI